MLISKFRVFRSHGVQYIKNLDAVVLPETFYGRPVISGDIAPEHAARLAALCPSSAIGVEPLSIDLGRCIFCGECARCAPQNICFSSDYRMGAATREDLIITANSGNVVPFRADAVRKVIPGYFSKALKLRVVSAGGDNSTEMELNASMNVNFDFSRYGIDFVASPRHADGIVVTGPISENMAESLEICYDAIAEPKVIILAGTDAVSGGLFASTPAIDRTFLDKHKPDLLLPGNPMHPMTFIEGVMALTGRKKRE